MRVRATPLTEFPEVPGGLLETPPPAQAQISQGEQGVTLVNGRLRVEISREGRLRFYNAQNGAALLEERAA